MKNLSNLTVLSIFSDHIGGSIPSFIGQLSNLIRLYLGACDCTGSIPSSFNNLTKLQDLDLSGNKLSGGIQLGNLTNLTSLNISYNLFTFQGIENIARKFPFAIYAPQSTLLTIHNKNGKLSVSAGGTLAKEEFDWYRNGNLVKRVTGDSTFTPQNPAGATYTVTVTNSIAVQLTLQSSPYTFPGFQKDFMTNAKVSENIGLSIYPNPVQNNLNISIRSFKYGTAQMEIADMQGRVLISNL